MRKLILILALLTPAAILADGYLYDPNTGEILYREGPPNPYLPEQRTYYDPNTGEHVYSEGRTPRYIPEIPRIGERRSVDEQDSYPVDPLYSF